MKDESKLSVAECAYCVIFSIGIFYFDKSEHRPIDIVPIIFGFIISFYYAFFKITISLHLERNDKISDVMAKFQKELDNKLCAILYCISIWHPRTTFSYFHQIYVFQK